MTSITGLLQKTKTYLAKRKKQTIVGVLALLLLSSYLIAVLVPRPVEYSYAGDSCVGKLTFLPSIQHTTEGSAYDITYRGGFELAGAPLIATEACFTPTEAPQEGRVAVATAPWGVSLARTQFSIEVPAAPTANVAPLERPVPTTKPLKIALDQPDVTFDYSLAVDRASTDCVSQGSSLECDITKLELEQGASYDTRLIREFDGGDRAEIHSGTLETLEPVQVKRVSIKNKQTIYERPKTFTVEVDKPLEQADVQLMRQRGDKGTEAVEHAVEVDETKLTIKLEDDLPRNVAYELTLAQLIADDGSTLVEPYKVDFRTSDGPKLAQASIGASRAPLSGTLTLTFDQPLSEDQNIASLVSVSGAQAAVSSSGSTIRVQYNGANKCSPVVVNIKAGLESKHQVKQTQPIRYQTRTICHTVETIGYSHEGRPINAYFFGSGSKTVLFTGAIHGNEKSSYATMQSWINELEARATEIPKDKQVVVVPMLSPDGYYVHGRDNARSVNLNRNFPTSNWEKDITISGGRTDKGGGGASPGSERETKALMALSSRLNPYITITYHSSGRIVNSNAHSRAVSLGAQYARQTGYWFVPDSATESTFGFAMTGTYEDWMAETGRPAFLIELPTDHGDYLYQNRTAMWAMLRS